MNRCRCGKFIAWGMCPRCWTRQVESLRIRIHAATERAGVCYGICTWWYR